MQMMGGVGGGGRDLSRQRVAAEDPRAVLWGCRGQQAGVPGDRVGRDSLRDVGGAS